MRETQVCEHKSTFDGSIRHKLQLVKEIVAMANSNGGLIHIQTVSCDKNLLDPARLADLVGKYVDPPINSLEVDFDHPDGCVITIGRSERRPHVIRQEGSYDSEGKKVSAFWPGQVYIREGTKAEPANAPALHAIIDCRVREWLQSLGGAIQTLSTKPVSDSGLPIRFSDQAGALVIDPVPPAALSELRGTLPVRIDPDADLEVRLEDLHASYPYMTKDLAKALGVSANWVAIATKALGLQEDRMYCYQVRYGKNMFKNYNEKTLETLRAIRQQFPNFSPHKKSDLAAVLEWLDESASLEPV
jgi:hypothetical protein